MRSKCAKYEVMLSLVVASLFATAQAFGGASEAKPARANFLKAIALKKAADFVDLEQCPLEGACLWSLDHADHTEEDPAITAQLMSFEHSCPLAMCRMFCEHGFAQDENGCDKCECAPSPCPLAMCMMFCENGFVKDDNGCDKCECADAPARRLLQTQVTGGSGGAVKGGSGGGGVTCPTGYTWGNPGEYCLGGDIWFCDRPGAYPAYLVNNCGGNGCVQNNPGFADYCNAPPSYSCIYNTECNYGEICINNQCQQPNGRSCIYDYECPSGQRCIYNYCEAQSNPTPPSRSCIYDNECPGSQICVVNQCQDRFTCRYDSDCNNRDMYCANNGLCYYRDTASPLDYYNSWYDYAIKNNNDRILDYIPSAEVCAEQCDNERSFNCRSFEYAPAGRRCVLSASGDTSLAVYAPGWNLYVRK